MASDHYSVHDSIAVITLDNPPVNAMGHALREEVAGHLATAWADASVAAIVIIGAGKLFCGGADVKAFGTPASRAEPSSRSAATIASPSVAPSSACRR